MKRKNKTIKIEVKEVKPRLAGGRKHTAMDSRPKRQRTRSAQRRAAISEF